jgi:cobaltochelatase CobS
MTKNISTINGTVLSSEYELVRNEKWFDYSIIKRETGEVVKNFEFRGPPSDLFDGLQKGSVSVPLEVLRNKNIVPKPTTIFNQIKVQPVNTPVPEQQVAHLSAAALSSPPIHNVIPLKKEVSLVSSFEKEAPSESVLINDPPKSYQGFYFPEFLPNFLNRVRSRRNIFLAGESGTGKSEMVQKLADFYGQTLIRVNFHQGVTESSLIGKYVVKNSETQFAYGLVPLAMKKGYWLLLDEIDYAEPEHTSVLQAVLEGKPLVITSNEGEILKAHPSFRIFATGNTTGRGDSTDSYHGTNFMNSAFLDRWTIFEMTYSKKESKIIENIVGDKEISKKLVKVFELFRGLKKNGDITNAVFSTRRMMNVAEALKMGDSISDSFKYEIFSRFNNEEIMILSECIRDIFDHTHYFENEWKLGQSHHLPQATIQNPNQPPEVEMDED